MFLSCDDAQRIRHLSTGRRGKWLQILEPFLKHNQRHSTFFYVFLFHALLCGDLEFKHDAGCLETPILGQLSHSSASLVPYATQSLPSTRACMSSVFYFQRQLQISIVHATTRLSTMLVENEAREMSLWSCNPRQVTAVHSLTAFASSSPQNPNPTPEA